MLIIHLVFTIIFFHLIICDDAVRDVLTEEGIHILNKDNFDGFINANDVVMVEFYAPWCGHCKAFTPVYVEAAEKLKAQNLNIPLSKVDATVEAELAERFGIAGYPTIKVFKSGLPYNYEGERTALSVINFLKKISSPDWKPPQSNILILTKDNFTEVVANSGYILVEFFAPWCGHCKNLAPEYDKAATILSKESPPIPLATVDATQETELAKEYGVSGYPTIKLFRNNKVIDYNGPRYADGIVEWMLKNRQNAAKQIESASELKRKRDPHKVLLLGLFSNENDLLYQVFIEATNQVRDDFSSAYSFSADIHKTLNIRDNDGIGSIVLFRPEYLSNKFESDHAIFLHEKNINTTVDHLVSFFEKEMFPIVAEYDYGTNYFLDRFVNKEILCLVFFTVDFTVHHRAATRKWLEKITKIAVNYKDNIQFAIADDEKQSNKLRELRLDDSGEEINVGCLKKGNIKYRMPPMEEFDSEQIRQFIDDMIAGKIFPLLKSSPVPQMSVSTGIKAVVGDTYKSLVNDATKEGLILLYRSPCDKCQASRAVLSELASKLSGKLLDVFSMDLSQNDLPPIDGLENVDSQPSLYLVLDKPDVKSKSLLKKMLVKYSGDLSSESEIRSFVIKNTKLSKDEL